MQQLGINLKEHAPDILLMWAQVLSEPPFRLPPGHDPGQLPTIIYELIEVSLLHPHDLQAHEHKVAAAIIHGERRRMDGSSERIIWEEFAALREAIRRYLERCPVSRWKRREAVMRLDMAISVTELAAVRGFHRRRFEEVGLWETLTTELARNSPLLGLPDPD